MKIYDLRSDTITKPSKGMRKAIADAEVGDDVLFEDPSVNRLEAMGAEMVGKEAALFVPTGSMGNLIPLYINGGRGSEVLTHKDSHILHLEVGSISAIAGVLPISIDTPRGILTRDSLKPHIRKAAYDLSPTTMIEVENTIAGICYPLENLKEIKALAEQNNIKVHIDGARIFNASVATNTPASVLASYGDTITFCLSKGLGAPVGSLLCGTKEFIYKARTVRKMLGSGMRQAGILAAAGLYALENNIERLSDDHTNAKIIADALKEKEWATFNYDDVETNMIFLSVENVDAERVVEVFAQKGVLTLSNNDQVRLVTNLDLSNEDAKEVATILSSIEKEDF